MKDSLIVNFQYFISFFCFDPSAFFLSFGEQSAQLKCKGDPYWLTKLVKMSHDVSSLQGRP